MKNCVKKIRDKKNISISELAEKLQIGTQKILEIENNIFMPDAIIALKLAKYLQVKVQEIFLLEESDYLETNLEM